VLHNENGVLQNEDGVLHIENGVLQNENVAESLLILLIISNCYLQMENFLQPVQSDYQCFYQNLAISKPQKKKYVTAALLFRTPNS
jgi:hypothetical protein